MYAVCSVRYASGLSDTAETCLLLFLSPFQYHFTDTVGRLRAWPRLRSRRRLTSVVPFESCMAGPDSRHSSAPPAPNRPTCLAEVGCLVSGPPLSLSSSAVGPRDTVPGRADDCRRRPPGRHPAVYLHGLSPPHYPYDAGSVRVVSGGGAHRTLSDCASLSPLLGIGWHGSASWVCVSVNSLDSVQVVMFTVFAHTLNTPQCVRVLSQSAGSRLRWCETISRHKDGSLTSPHLCTGKMAATECGHSPPPYKRLRLSSRAQGRARS